MMVSIAQCARHLIVLIEPCGIEILALKCAGATKTAVLIEPCGIEMAYFHMAYIKRKMF